MLVTLGVVALLAAQPAAAVRSPYLDVVRRYGSGHRAPGRLTALAALRLSKPDQVIDELDTAHLHSARRAIVRRAGGSRPARDDVRGADTRRVAIHLYPRALALHVEALAACDLEPGSDHGRPAPRDPPPRD